MGQNGVVFDIPLRPKTSGVSNLILVPNELQTDAEGVPSWAVTERREFAVGAEYPASFRIALGNVMTATPCGALSGEVIFERIAVQGEGDARLEDPRTVVFDNIAVGRSRPSLRHSSMRMT